MEMRASRTSVIAAFLAVYIIWGSTYIGILFAIETMPPLLMAGMRFGLAGAILYGIARWNGAPNPTRAEWRSGTIVGSLLMTGNACVALAESRIPSGVAALLVAMTPLFMVLIDWARPGGRRPSVGVFVGLFVGLAGVAALLGPTTPTEGARIDLVGAAIVIFGSFAWSSGSIYARQAPKPASAIAMTATQLVTGGSVLILVAIAAGELVGFDPAAISARSWLAFVYLLIFGSLIAFTAFVYLLRVSTPARVSTYAYVNPVVAVFLGWLLAGESITARMLISAAVIVGGVALITTAEGRAATARVAGQAGGDGEAVTRARRVARAVAGRAPSRGRAPNRENV